MKAEEGLALQDIISGIFDYIATIEFPAQSRIYLLDNLAQVECVPRLQLHERTAYFGDLTDIACQQEATKSYNLQLYWGHLRARYSYPRKGTRISRLQSDRISHSKDSLYQLDSSLDISAAASTSEPSFPNRFGSARNTSLPSSPRFAIAHWLVPVRM